ncbi:TonB-dependent siderophore receptor [Variovorax sp. PCZ-1]|uniref:TonB-dependent siderophore receptor n=1 Tax=Variovorax sp. PCZ-1 TaxID=2835533 RepID=UPI001BCF07DC|nr:TonB-dependent siderophore receptor [Variovorax sp. PCZ-1]MBS7807139.1 TonB-dependent siderophore receptor [Variovorax sp. PCZ-1]
MTKHTQKLSFFAPFFNQKQAIAGIDTARNAILLIASATTCLHGLAQTSSQEITLKPVVISAPTQRQQLGIGGFDAPLSEQPISATVITAEDIKASGAQRLSDLYKLDSSVSDAYNAVGYIDYATVRGFVIDNKFNYRRDGLPISGDTAIHLANKERVEILKGTSGIQAGTSAPGGLVNYVVKRPTSKPIRSMDLSADSNGQLGAALDLGGRFGADNAQGYRLNVATDRLSSSAPGTRGNKQLLALSLDSRVGRDGLLEAEFEWARQSQPNVPGLSVLGSTGLLPPADPKLNLNRQAWSQHTEFEGLTGSLRYTQAINDQWQWSAHLGSQRLKTDDRIAFPFGCGNAGSGACNAFYDNGDVDIYDFASVGERRKKAAAQFKLDGSLQTGSVRHALSLGALQSNSRIQTSDQIFAYAGTLNLNTPNQPLPANPAATPNSANTLREKTRELFATDVISWNESFKTWLGLRHTSVSRQDQLNASNYSQNFTTPWLAASYQTGAYTLYASHGQGIESDIVAALNTTNPNQVLPARRSRQTEIGIKHSSANQSWQATVFDITRPMSSADACGLAGISPCNVQPDGSSQHQGLELSAQKQLGAWQLGGSGTWLRAERQGSTTAAAINGLKPTNVPSHILRLNAAYRIAPDWLVGAHIGHEGKRAILPDNSLQLPAWTRLDASLKWDTQINGAKSSLQINIHNLLDKRFFQESPYQFGHAYLFPAQARALRMSLNISL